MAHRKLAARIVVVALAASSVSLAQGSPEAPAAADAAAPAEGGAAPEAAPEGVGDVAPAKEPEPVLPPAQPMTDDDDARRLEALRDLVRRYEEEARDFREEVRLVAERKYKERRAAIESSYDKALAPVIAAERRYRLDAIASFERFLERHPASDKYTPDAMFRLAELYFEKYDDDYQLAMKDFRDAYQKWSDAGSNGDPPAEPEPKFPRTVELYQQLIARFPEYRLLDGAYYLLGYTLKTQGEDKEGLAAWRTLVDRYPNSRFYAEVWFRIGDYHFEEEEWESAIAAFMKVVPEKDSPFYDKGVYKLAWTYYLINRFDDGVTRFFELLDYSYAKKAQEGGEGVGSVLEEEGLQYVAISFSDDNWQRPDEYKRLISGASLQDEFADIEIDYVAFAIDYFAKVGERPYERDVMARLGDILFKQSKNKQAVAALKHAIAKFPMHRDAPKLQDLVVQAYERERMFDEASVERDALVANYSEGSAWAKAHMNDSQARREAKDLARISLYKAAIYYHTQAQKYFDDDKQDLGVKSFEAASAAYRNYLTQYPHDKQAYELTYYLAETYYYSLHFPEAADTYEKVRDSTAGKLYKVDSARNVVYALEKVIAAQVKAGELPEKDPFKKSAEEAEKAAAREKAESEQKAAAKKKKDAAPTSEAPPAETVAEAPPAEPELPAAPEEIAPLRQRYITGIDKMLEVAPKDEVAPNFAYNAASIYYAHGHFDEAMRRFEIIVNEYPGHEAARFAANLILDRLLAQKDWRRAAEYAKRFTGQFGGQDVEATAAFAKIEGGAKFKIATEVLDEGQKDIDEGRIADGIAKLEEGAEGYLKLVGEDPKREFADLMVYNAAVSLERARRPARAAELYERVYKEYPDSKYAAQAMFNVASKSEQAFDFDKAVKTYLELVKKYPESEKRADAQINAALALEGQQKYERAADEFQRFAALFPERPEAAEVFFRSAIVHKKREARGDEIKALRDFIGKYKSQPAQIPRVVEAHARLGDIDRERAEEAKQYADKKRYADSADESYRAAIREFAKAKGSASAAYFAAKASYHLAGNDYDSYERMKIAANTGKKQGEELAAKAKRLEEVKKTFEGVITTYKQADWSLASLYRIGALYDDLRKKIIEAPCPADIKRIDPIACDEYRVVLEDQAFAVEEKAVEAYRTAYERAKELKVQNEWTKKTLDALNRLRQSDFPIDKDPIEDGSTGDLYDLGFVYPNGGAQELQRLEGGG